MRLTKGNRTHVERYLAVLDKYGSRTLHGAYENPSKTKEGVYERCVRERCDHNGTHGAVVGCTSFYFTYMYMIPNLEENKVTVVRMTHTATFTYEVTEDDMDLLDRLRRYCA